MWTVMLASLLGAEPDPGVAEESKEVDWWMVTPKKWPKPKYPKEARELGVEGECEVRFFIDTRGKVTEAEIERCPKVFQESALQAAERTTFFPYKSDGQRYAVNFVLTYTFVLR